MASVSRWWLEVVGEGMGRGGSGVLTDAVGVFGSAIFDISGVAVAVALFGNTMFDMSGFTDAIAVFANAILDISSMAREELSSVANLGRLWALGSSLGGHFGSPWSAHGTPLGDLGTLWGTLG